MNQNLKQLAEDALADKDRLDFRAGWQSDGAMMEKGVIISRIIEREPKLARAWLKQDQAISVMREALEIIKMDGNTGDSGIDVIAIAEIAVNAVEKIIGGEE